MSRITRGIATLSWIDPATGLPEVDSAGDPGSIVSYGRIIAEAGYRFSHLLEAWLEVDTTAGAIIGGNFAAASGIYRAPSYLGLASAPVGNIGRTINRTNPKAVTFRQLVGCRTESPEKIGRGAGAAGGGLAGFTSTGLNPIGGIVGAYVGSKVGHGTAQEVKAFPPIWTELELTINIDGTFTHKLLRHSLFPSVSYYAQVVTPAGYVVSGSYSRQGSYDAVPMLDAWYEGGWGLAGGGPITWRPGDAPTPGNPWGMTKATFTADSSLSAKPAGF
jgi:hypothetical protein